MMKPGVNPPAKGIRWAVGRTPWGYPVLSIALGPDMERGDLRGHARGMVAIGDIATGWIAAGGVAWGGLAFGGLALGLIAIGGLAVGGVALGGLALGGIAWGGGAVGLVAMGGGAVGYYACGGGAWGKYVLSALVQDVKAREFFSRYFSFLVSAFLLPLP